MIGGKMDFFDSANRFGRFQERMTCFGRLRVLPRGEKVSYRPSACFLAPSKGLFCGRGRIGRGRIAQIGVHQWGERKKEL